MWDIDKQFRSASGYGDIAKMQQLWQQRPKPNVNSLGAVCMTPLHQAACGGDIEAIQLLKSFGAHVNARDDFGKTPLHYAAAYGHTAAIQLLKSFGVDVSAKTNDGRTPLMLAQMYNKDLDTTTFLTQWEAEVASQAISASASKRTYPTYPSSSQSSVSLLPPKSIAFPSPPQTLPSASMREIDTQFRDAAEAGDIAKMQQLWQQNPKPDVNAKDDAGWDSLHYAAFNGNIEVMQLLKSFGADVNAQDNNCWTPLHRAAMSGQIEAMQLLKSFGADVNAKDLGGDTPLMIAQEWDKEQAATFLREWEVEATSQPPAITTSDSQLQRSTREELAKMQQLYLELQAQLQKPAASQNSAKEQELQQHIAAHERTLFALQAQLSTHDAALMVFDKMRIQFDYYSTTLLAPMALKHEQKALLKQSPKLEQYYNSYSQVLCAMYMAAMVIESELVTAQSTGKLATGADAAKVGGEAISMIAEHADKITGIINISTSVTNAVPVVGPLISLAFKGAGALVQHLASKEQRATLRNLTKLAGNPQDWHSFIEEVTLAIITDPAKQAEIEQLTPAKQEQGLRSKVSGWYSAIKSWVSTSPEQDYLTKYAAEDAAAGLAAIFAGKVTNLTQGKLLVDLALKPGVKQFNANANSTSTNTNTTNPGHQSPAVISANRVAIETKTEVRGVGTRMEVQGAHVAIVTAQVGRIDDQVQALQRQLADKDRKHAEEMAEMRRMVQQLALAQQGNSSAQGAPASPLPSATPSTPAAALAGRTATRVSTSGAGALL